MKKILFILILVSQMITGQEYQKISKIPKHVNSQKIINNYLNAIGGEKKLKEIKTLQKKSQIKIIDVPNFNMEGEVLYKTPNLYASILKIEELGQIQSTKYNGKICVIERFHNNEKTKKSIDGVLLEEKMKDFYPFPILEAKNNNIQFKVVEILKNKTNKIYKVYMDDPTIKDSIFFFFDAKTHYMSMKQEVGLKTIKTTEYKNYITVENIEFPFLEFSTIKIDNKIAQTSENSIIEIIINEKIQLDKFE